MSTPEVEQASLQDDIASAFDEQAGIEEATVEETTIEPEITEPAYEPPAMWSKEYKEVFNEWGQLERGREYQKAMLDLYGNTQKHVTQKEQEAAQYRQQVEQWNGVFGPYQQEMNIHGTNGPEFMQQLLRYYQHLTQNPAQAIQQLAENYNIDLANINAEQPYMSPAEKANAQRIQQLERAYQQNQVQARHQAVQTIQQQIDTFASETDASGTPLRPHFEQVKDTMTKLIRGGNATGLNDAYDMACKLSPELMAQVEAQRVAAESARKAADAKKAKTASVRATGKHTGKATTRSLKEDIAATYDDLAAA